MDELYELHFHGNRREIEKEKQRKREAEEKGRLNALRAKRFMESLMLSNNARFKDKPHKEQGGG